MASGLIGVFVEVTLREPPGVTVHGIVAHIQPSESLTLQHVRIPDSEYYHPQMVFPAGNVANIRDLGRTPQPEATPSVHSTFAELPDGLPAPVSKPTLQDPAIMSIGKRPTPSQIATHQPPPYQPDVTGDSVHISTPTELSGLTSSHATDLVDPSSIPAISLPLAQLKISSPESVRFDTAEEVGTADTAEGPSAAGKKPSKRKRRGRGKGVSADNEDSVPQGDGWRQTPMLESTKSFQPFASLKRGKKGRGELSIDNGWASEDVTDVQEAGDFDFEGSLAKFDKRTLFKEMREQDEIADADRLVSHNRLPRPKPGTGGGKNFHYSENVLDQPSSSQPKLKETPDDFWKSEADEGTLNGGERLSGREGSGRNSRLRGDSRMSASRRSQSRKASATASVGGPGAGPSRVNPGQPGSSTLLALHAHEGFYNIETERRIETVTHLQMLNLESIAHNEIGLTEDLMAENAGRSIAEVALTALNDPAIKLRAASMSPSSTPTIVVLAGNNKSGTRSIAAARHLRNRGINVLVCVIGIERENDLIEDLRRQVRLYRSFGGVVCSNPELFENLNKASNSFSSPGQVMVTLIIDALLGLSIVFEELRKSDQATTYELMEWANRNEAFVLAIDVPSGIEPTSGKVSIIDGSKLYVRPRYVVALGAPKQGLLKLVEAVEEEEDSVEDHWRFFLGDMGLGAAVWRKAATKIRRGIDFDDRWVLEMKYQTQVIS